jgi:hypothetical protein
VSQLLVSYNSPVSIANVLTDFTVLDANGKAVPITVNTNGSFVTNLSGDSYTIVGLSESGNTVTVTLQPGTDGNGPATPSDYWVGETVILSGITDQNGTPIAGYDGDVVVTSVSNGGYTFTFNAASTGLATVAPVDDEIYTGVETGTDVPIGGTNTFLTVSVTGASWSSSNGGTATITANNNFTVGERVTVFGIGGATGYNGTVTITAATATSFSYALGTQPSGTAGFGGAVAYASSAVVSATNVTQVIITFDALNEQGVASDAFVYASGAADGLGNTIGVSDGNYFLHTTVADITSNGYALDGAHDGMPGSTTAGSGVYGGGGTAEVDEVWRLFGDVLGLRSVTGQDTAVFRTTYGSTGYGAADGGTGDYLWYFDYDMDGNINTTDLTQYGHRLNTVLSE